MRTRSLLLASYLIERGHEPTMTGDGNTIDGHALGAWEFPQSDALQNDVREFERGNARVEPRSFYRRVKEVRRVLFDFLGVGGRGH